MECITIKELLTGEATRCAAWIVTAAAFVLGAILTCLVCKLAKCPGKCGSKPAADKQTVAAPVVDKPADDKPADEAPVVDSKPAEEKPVVEKPTTATYGVQEGDDMTGVSIRWGVSAAEIRELNNFGENDQLKPGQIIKLPAEAQQ